MILRLALCFAAAAAAQTIVPLANIKGSATSPILSPDGKTLVFESTSFALYTRPLAGGTPVRFAGRDNHDGSPASALWSPDGNHIAFSRIYCHFCERQLFVKPYPSGREQHVGSVCDSFVWSPDGHFLIGTEPKGDFETCRVVLISLNGGPRVRLGDGDVVALSPDGKRLAYAAQNVLRLATLTPDFRIDGKPVTLASEPHAIGSIHWTPDGKGILVDSRKLISLDRTPASRMLNFGRRISISQILPDGTALGTQESDSSSLWRWDAASSDELRKVRDIPWTDSVLTVSPDGKQVAFVTDRNGPDQIWVSNLDGSHGRVIVAKIPPFVQYGDNTHVLGMSWSPDQKWIAMMTNPGINGGNFDARLFLIASAGGTLRTLVQDCSKMGEPVWSADSRYVYFAQTDTENYKNTHFRIDIETGQQNQVREEQVPPRPGDDAPLPPNIRSRSVAEGGRFVYYLEGPEYKPRMVSIPHALGQ
jgi:Tol biopolymer transport system component